MIFRIVIYVMADSEIKTNMVFVSQLLLCAVYLLKQRNGQKVVTRHNYHAMAATYVQWDMQKTRWVDVKNAQIQMQTALIVKPVVAMAVKELIILLDALSVKKVME